MEDAPGKPDPTGLFSAIAQLYEENTLPVVYVGDTVADMQTITKAKIAQPERRWFAIGVLPPHVRSSSRAQDYAQRLQEAGAIMVLNNVEELSQQVIQNLITT